MIYIDVGTVLIAPGVAVCGNQVFAIHLDRRERLWFGTFDGGVCWFDGASFQVFDRADPVAGGRVTHIFEDRDGVIWFGGSRTLGYYYDGRAFHDLAPACQPHSAATDLDTCHGIAQDRDGHMWFGNWNCLLRYDGREFRRFDSADGLPPTASCYPVAQDGAGDLWVGGRQIGRWDGRTFDPAAVDFSGRVRKVQRDRQGRMWFCTIGNEALCWGELDVEQRLLRLANGGIPYPYHFRAATGEVVELEVDAYPLGVRAEVEYEVIEAALAPGDYVVFCSDGIIEAGDGDGEIFGFARTVEAIRAGCIAGLADEALIDAVLATVKAFSGDAPQEDDMTCVVLQVNGEN